MKPRDKNSPGAFLLTPGMGVAIRCTMRREHRVPIKLGPGRAPGEVVLTSGEKKALEAVAESAGYSALSTFIRDVCAFACGGEGDYLHFVAAAGLCRMPMGRWMREVVLEAIAFPRPSLATHKKAARAFVVSKLR